MKFRIWNNFSRMVQEQKKTLIITTHYIEEASKADRVRFYFFDIHLREIIIKCIYFFIEGSNNLRFRSKFITIKINY